MKFEEEIKKINNMSHEEIAKLWRFTPSGHPYFDCSLPYYEAVEKRFKKFGGMTTEVSKNIGWG